MRSGRPSGSINFAMPKSRSFGTPCGRDENVARFEIAMDDEIPVGMFDGRADQAKEPQSVLESEDTGRAVTKERFALDEFQNEIRQAVGNRSGVEQPSDVGMIETCEDPAFRRNRRRKKGVASCGRTTLTAVRRTKSPSAR